MNQYDITQLPEPNLIEPLNFEEAFERVKKDFLTRAPEFNTLLESDPAMKLLESFAYSMMDRINKNNEKAKQTMLSFATGTNLDQIAANTGTLRHVIIPEDLTANPPIEAVYESDVALRKRAQNAPERFTVAGPINAYNALAMDCDGLVRDAGTQAHTPEPGCVTVTILSHDNEGVASNTLVNKVYHALNADDVRPCCDTVYVQAAEILDIKIHVKLTCYAGADQDQSVINAQKNLNDYAQSIFRINSELTLSAIHDNARVKGVHKVTVLEPGFDNSEVIRTNPNQAIRCKVIVEKGEIYDT